MLNQYLLALILPPLLLIGWFAVQQWWRSVFSTPDTNGDVLAGRGDCGKCGCAKPCERATNDPRSTPP